MIIRNLKKDYSGKLALRCSSALALVLLFAMALFGQTDRGAITGNITDSTGGSVPNASIDVKNVDTGAVFHGGTSTTGNYVIPVPTGKYQMTVTVPGFKKYVRENLQVNVATDTRQDVVLQVGQVSDTITVVESAPLLNTESGELSHTITTDDVNQLPVLTTAGGSWYGATGMGNIRNPLQESELLPGVSFANDQALVVNGIPSNSESIRVEGQDTTSNIWKVEQQNSQGGVDAIQEVAIQTSNFAAEYGQAAGGYFNYTMKSGTNQLHGSAYDYFVNEFMNAGLPFTDAGTQDPSKEGQHIRNVVRRSDFGGTFGGPVRIPKLYNGRDKTFFFVNFEQFRQNNIIANGISTVPTLAYRSGNFATAGCFAYVGGTAAGGGVCAFAPGNEINTQTGAVATDPAGNTIGYGQIFDPNTTHTVNGETVRTPFPGNVIPVSRMDPVALAIQNLMPLPNAPGIENNYIIPAYDNYQHTTNFSFKLDHSLSSTIKLSAYYTQLLTYSPNANGFAPAIGGATPTDTWNHTVRLNYDQTITPTLLLHVGIGWFDTSEPNLPVSYNQSQLGLTGYYDSNLFPTLTGLTNFISGGWGPGFGEAGGSFSAEIWEQKPTGNTSLTWVRGNHTFKAGADYTGEGYPDQSNWRANGNFAFSNAETSDPYQNGLPLNYGNSSGYSYASYFLGLPDTLSLSPPTDTRLGNHALGLFIQDSWKVTRKLTLDYGLRYDYNTYLKEQYGRTQDASFTTPNASAGGRDGAVIYEATCGCSFSHNYPYGFGPRLGGAYQIDSKTVLRGGIGVQYDSPQAPNGVSYSAADYYQINPSGYGISPLTASGGLAGGNPYAPGNPYGNTPLVWPNFNNSKYPLQNAGLAAPYSPFIYFDPENRPGRIFTWSIGVQREVMHNLVAEVSYVGNRGAWFPAPSIAPMASNSLTLQGLESAYGLNVASTAASYCDAAGANCQTAAQLLTDQISAPQVIQRFPALANPNSVYPGFPSTQTLAQALRPVPQWDGLTTWLGPPTGDTWYDSMQIKVTKRFSHGLSAQGNYTWAKGLVDGASSDSTYFLPGAVATNDLYNFAQNKQLNQYVMPQAMTITFTYTTPKTPTTSTAMKFVSQIARDWQIGAVLRYQSGQLIETPTSANQLGTELDRPNQTYWNYVPGANPLLVNPNCGCFNPQTAQVLNPAAWTDAPTGTFGVSAPYYNNYRWQRQPAESMSLARNFRVGKEGKYNLQVRAEFYNIFNRLFLSMPSTAGATGVNPYNAITTSAGVNTGGYGSVATVGGAGAQPRNGQLVARFTF